MQTIKTVNRVAKPIKIITTWFILAILVIFVQTLASELYWEFSQQRNRSEQIARQLTEQEKQQKQIHEAQKEFTREGQFYLAQYNITTPGKLDNKRTAWVKDQNGNFAFEGSQDDLSMEFIQWYRTDNQRFRYQNQRFNERDLKRLNSPDVEFSRHYSIPIVNSDNRRIGHWFFNADRQIFEGYAVSGKHLGWMGANGYTKQRTAAQPFGTCVMMESWVAPDTFDPMIIYQARYAVYQINFGSQHVDTLAKTKDDPIRYIQHNNWKEFPDFNNRPLLAIGTESGKLYIRLKNPDQTIESQLDDYPQIAAAGDRVWIKTQDVKGRPSPYDRDAYMQWWNENRNKPKDWTVCLYEVTNDGALQKKNEFAWTQPVDQFMVIDTGKPNRFQTVTASISSPVPAWIVQCTGYRPEWLRDFFKATAPVHRFRLPVNLCVMTLLAVLTFLHGRPRQTNKLKLAVWVLFVFLFNLIGLLTYLSLNHTAVITCTNCQKHRGLSADKCTRCGTELPSPKRKQTDILIPMPI